MKYENQTMTVNSIVKKMNKTSQKYKSKSGKWTSSNVKSILLNYKIIDNDGIYIDNTKADIIAHIECACETSIYKMRKDDVIKYKPYIPKLTKIIHDYCNKALISDIHIDVTFNLHDCLEEDDKGDNSNDSDENDE